MNTRTLTQELERSVGEISVLDIHTHLVGGNLGARGLHDLLLYHMVVSDLYAAGLFQRGAFDPVSTVAGRSRGS